MRCITQKKRVELESKINQKQEKMANAKKTKRDECQKILKAKQTKRENAKRN